MGLAGGYFGRAVEFIALDFETATPQPDSACQLGIAIVRGGVVRQVRSWSIKPPQWPWFSPWNIAVHGIRPEDVARAPRWPEVWLEVEALLRDATVVAHNAAFDMGVLRATLASHGLPHPRFRYFCSASLARRVWPGHPSYGLGPLCALQGIALKHHHAGHDARAAAELVLRAADRLGADGIERLLEACRLNTGAFFPGGQRTPGGKVVRA